MSRKTFSVEELRSRVNHSLAENYPYEGGRQYRHGLIDAIEFVLHSTGNYKGYRYLTSTELPDGVKPGIRMTPDGSVTLPYPERFADTDESRRYYY